MTQKENTTKEDKKLQTMDEICDNTRANQQQRELAWCVNTVQQCQQQAAKLIDHDLERHALNPAVKTVVALADEIIRANDTANKNSVDKTKCVM